MIAATDTANLAVVSDAVFADIRIEQVDHEPLLDSSAIMESPTVLQELVFVERLVDHQFVFADSSHCADGHHSGLAQPPADGLAEPVTSPVPILLW